MSVVLWSFHLKGSGVVTPPTPPRRVGLGGIVGKRKKPHSEYIREAVEALLAMEPGTPQYRASLAKARSLAKTKHAEKNKQHDDEEVFILMVALDLL